MTRVMGVDLGAKRTGVAISAGSIAHPLTVLDASGSELVDRLADLARDEGVTDIVVGDPIRLDGTLGAAAEQARETAECLRRATGLEVTLWDERLSTAEVERTMVRGGVRRRARRAVVDKLAAAVLLQSYLDARASREAAP
jgi:putative Holliday junction resolvase